MSRDRLNPVEAINQVRLTAKLYAVREFEGLPPSLAEMVVDQVFNEMLTTLSTLRRRLDHLQGSRPRTRVRPSQRPSEERRQTYASTVDPVEERRWARTTLGVTAGATSKEIKQRYRTLAKRYHPDQHPPAQREEMDKLMRDIIRAYTILSQS